MRIAYIHPGLPKTGTTTFQKVLHQHRSQLLKADFEFVNAGSRPDYAADVYATVFDAAHCAQRPGFSEENLGRLWSLVADSTATYLMISSEYLSSADLAAREAFVARLRDSGFDEVNVSVSARELGPLLASAWAQSIRTRTPGVDRDRVDLRAYLNAWVDGAQGDGDPRRERSVVAAAAGAAWEATPGVGRVDIHVVGDGEGATSLGEFFFLSAREWWEGCQDLPLRFRLMERLNAGRKNTTAAYSHLEVMRLLLNAGLVDQAQLPAVERCLAEGLNGETDSLAEALPLVGDMSELRAFLQSRPVE